MDDQQIEDLGGIDPDGGEEESEESAVVEEVDHFGFFSNSPHSNPLSPVCRTPRLPTSQMLIRHVCSGWILLPYAPEPPAGAHGGPTLLSGRARVVRGVRRGRAQGVGHAGEQVETRSLYYSLSHSILSHTLLSLTLYSLSHSFSLTLFLSHTLSLSHSM